MAEIFLSWNAVLQCSLNIFTFDLEDSTQSTVISMAERQYLRYEKLNCETVTQNFDFVSKFAFFKSLGNITGKHSRYLFGNITINFDLQV